MAKLQVNIVFSILTLSLWGAAMGRPKELRKARSGPELIPDENKVPPGEPNCDELRAMWRFSKRQSRAAEITNEIPTYKDPLAYNVWDHYPKPRSVLGAQLMRSKSKPVYGRIVLEAPGNHPRVRAEGRIRDGGRGRPEVPSYRVPGGLLTGYRPIRKGSFQRLKEIILAQRLKDLQKQRMLEESIGKPGGEAMPHENIDSSDYDSRYPDEDSRQSLWTGDTDYDIGYDYDSYVRPHDQVLAFNSEPSDERLW